MNRRWVIFWLSGLVAFIAIGAGLHFQQQIQAEQRGIEQPTRQAEMPTKLPLAGVNVELTQYDDLNAELEKMAALGIFWLRQPFLWSEIEPTQGELDWSSYDRIIEAVAAYGDQFQVVALLDGSPSWARHPHAPEHPFAPPASPAAYGDFAAARVEVRREGQGCP